MNKIIKQALINSISTAVYIILVVSFIFSLQKFQILEGTVFIPIAMLLLFVSSAGITGTLVLGKPIMLYLDGKKKEAVSLLGYTLGILLTMTALAFILLAVMQDIHAVQVPIPLNNTSP